MRKMILAVSLCCLTSAFLGAAAATLYCAQESERTLESMAASHAAERRDWQRADRALAGVVLAEHTRLVAAEKQRGDVDACEASGLAIGTAAAREQAAGDAQAAAVLNAINSSQGQAPAAAAPAATDPSSLLPGILGFAAKLLFRR